MKRSSVDTSETIIQPQLVKNSSTVVVIQKWLVFSRECFHNTIKLHGSESHHISKVKTEVKTSQELQK